MTEKQLDINEVVDEIIGSKLKEAREKYNIICLDEFIGEFKSLSPEDAYEGIELNFDDVSVEGGYAADEESVKERAIDEFYDEASDFYALGIITDDLKLIPIDNLFMYDSTDELLDDESISDSYRDAIPSIVYCDTYVEVPDDADSYHDEYEESADFEISGSPNTWKYCDEIFHAACNKVNEIYKIAEEKGLTGQIKEYLKKCVKEIKAEKSKQKETSEKQ